MFEPSPPEADDAQLLLGRGAQARRRRIYLETLDSVVIPGAREYGVDTAPLRRWADEKRVVVAALEACQEGRRNESQRRSRPRVSRESRFKGVNE
jgi:hypothetical protein